MCTSWVEYISNINIVVLVTSDAFEWVCSDNERRISRLGRCGCREDNPRDPTLQGARRVGEREWVAKHVLYETELV